MRVFVVSVFLAAFIALTAHCAFGAESEVDMLLNMLEKKGIMNKDEVAEFRADVAMKKQEIPSQMKPATVPEWTQNVKWGGDVRFRTRGDWGKPAQNQPQNQKGTANNLTPTNSSDIRRQRLQESVRGRFAIEAKVNDSTYAGARFEGGGTNPRSGDDTLNGYFNKAYVMFDQYYIRFQATKNMVMRFGQYFSDMKLWVGKFQNPFESSEMVWDTDITPGGIAFQYASPDIKAGDLPGFNIYSNLGMLWLDESASFNTDPLLCAFQAGAKTEQFGPLGSTMSVFTTMYDFANLQGKTPNTNSAGTNSRTWLGDYGYRIGASSLGTYKYEYNVFDLLVRIDNEKIGDYNFPHGFIIDFIYNASVHDESTNKGASIGAYIGKKKLKDAGDWRVGSEWRFIERDAIPDFLPDSNFYGFGTYVNTATRPNVNGLGVGGGTNTRGIKTTVEYQLLKNTVVNLSYYWMEPIKSYDKRNPWNQVLVDLITKF